MNKNMFLNITDIFSLFICYGFFLLFCGIILFGYKDDQISFTINDYGEKYIEFILISIMCPLVSLSVWRGFKRIRDNIKYGE